MSLSWDGRLSLTLGVPVSWDGRLSLTLGVPVSWDGRLSLTGCPSQLGWEIISDSGCQSAGMGDCLWMLVSWDGRLSSVSWDGRLSSVSWDGRLSSVSWDGRAYCVAVSSLCRTCWVLDATVLIAQKAGHWKCPYCLKDFPWRDCMTGAASEMCQISVKHTCVKFLGNTFT